MVSSDGSHRRLSSARRLTAFSLLLGVALGVAPGPLLPAQEGEAPDIQIVVTATRLPTPTTELPAHVTVISAADIREDGATTVLELLDQQAGISVVSYSSEAQAQIDMRGFGTGGIGRTLVLVDGRAANNPDLSGVDWLAIPLERVERIEVVRGAASARYGNHAVAGVINIITRDVAEPLELGLALQLGSYGEQRQALSVGHGADWGSLDASVERYLIDGYRDRTALQSLGFDLDATLIPTEKLEFAVGGRWSQGESEQPGALSEAQWQADPRQAANQADEARENEARGTFDARLQLAPLLRLDLGVQLGQRETENDTASSPSYTTRILSTSIVDGALLADWQLGRSEGRARIGLDYYQAVQEGIGYSSDARVTRSSESQLSQVRLGAALSSSALLPTGTALDAALRYDQARAGAEKASEGIDSEKLHQAVVFDLGAVQRIAPGIEAWGSGATLFRYPAIDEQADLNSPQNRFEDDLDPERGFSLDAGLRLLSGDLLELSLGGYWLELRDEIRFAFDAAIGASRNQNIGATRRLGVETDLVLRPLGWLALQATYSAGTARFTTGDNEGRRIPLTAVHQLDAELAVTPVEGLRLGPQVSARSSMYPGGDESNTQEPVPALFLLDLQAAYQRPLGPGSLALTAEVANLLDARYAPIQFDFGSRSYYPAPGRRWRISTSYRY